MAEKQTVRNRRRRKTKEPRNIVDISIREIVRACPEIIPRILGLNIDPADIHAEDTTINTRNRQADNLILIRESGEDVGGIIVEWVSQPDNDDLIDYIEKWANLLAKFGFPIILLVIYLKPGDRKTFPDRYSCRIGSLETATSFVTLNLWEFLDRIESGEWIEFVPLLPVCKGVDHLPANVKEAEEATANVLASRELILKAEIADSTRSLLLGSLFSIATKSLPDERLIELFRKDITMIKDAPIIRDWMEQSKAEGITIGEERGISIGKGLGISIGKELAAESVRRSTLNLIKAKFNDIPEELEQRVRRSDIDWCERLENQILAIKSLEKLDLNSI